MRTILIAPFALSFAATALVAQGTNSDFTWSGKIDGGHWLYVHNMNGPVRVEKGTGDRVEVSAVKNWRRGNPDEVRIETKKTSSGDVLICAFWVEDASCDEHGYRSHGNNRNDTSVEFVVKLPAGVRISASTVNGSVIGLADNPLTLAGNSDIIINSTGTSQYPAGVFFGSQYVPLSDTYKEVHP